MEHEIKDRDTLEGILKEIADIESFTSGIDKEEFFASSVLQKAVAMSIIIISERAKHFSPHFIEVTNHIPWHNIRGLRNIAAHHYASIDRDRIWGFILGDIPALRDALNEYRSTPTP